MGLNNIERILQLKEELEESINLIDSDSQRIRNQIESTLSEICKNIEANPNLALELLKNGDAKISYYLVKQLHEKVGEVDFSEDKLGPMSIELGSILTEKSRNLLKYEKLVQNIPQEKITPLMKRLIGHNMDCANGIYMAKSSTEESPLIKKYESVAFDLISEVLRYELGVQDKKWTGTYWAGGSDVEICLGIGGQWNYVSLDYNNKKGNWKKIDNPEKVKEAGFLPISWDLTTGELPPEINQASQDLAIIRDSWDGRGSSYLEIKEYLWQCAIKSLNNPGIIIANVAGKGPVKKIENLAGIAGFDDISHIIESNINPIFRNYSLYRLDNEKK